MSELALQLIHENIKKHQRGEDARSLDLGNCGLTEVPQEIGQCSWLEELILVNNTQQWNKKKWIDWKSQNTGDSNTLSSLPDSFASLNGLKKLYINDLNDISLITELKNLKELLCENLQISNISSLAKLTSLQILDLSSSKITDLAPLTELIGLQQLFCNRTQITDLSPLSKLINLWQFQCQSTSISDLAPIVGLNKLQILDCHSTSISNLAPIAGLKKLKMLNLGHTKIADLASLIGLSNLRDLRCRSTSISDLAPIAGLKKLQVLDLNSTKISDLTPLTGLSNLINLDCRSAPISNLAPIAGLKKLLALDLNSTEISDLTPLTGLSNLINLDCRSTSISNLAPIAGLKKLKMLNLGHTKIVDLAPLTGLSNLKNLDCRSTSISDLAPIAGLKKLLALDLSSTKISDLAPLAQRIKNNISVIGKNKFGYFGIFVKNCPLIIPPLEFATESPQAVRDYFEELGGDGRKLNEIKIIFLGEASSGKTSLVKQLMQEDFNPDESQTHGIRIRKMPFTMSDGDTVNAHLWDFGGQEVMHATHQLFLSQRCIYVLLLNSRNDDRAEKWLKHATSFGGHSPVLVVLNKIDENPSFDVNRKSLREKYPQILDFYRVSCQSGEGVNELFQALCSEIDNSITRRTPFPVHWLAVKNYFANEMKADYIESAHYRQICINNSVSRPFSQDVLLQFLHDLGVIINFRNLKNFDTHILNPLWLTNGIYRIINSKIVGENSKGLLYENDFDAVINDPRYNNKDMSEIQFQYPKNKLHYIVRIMQEFELCFMLNTQTYVIPQLLPVQEPEVDMGGSVLHFIIDFPDFLPDSFFPRLMVKLHDFIAGEQRWRTGMVLYKPIVFDAQGRIRWDKEDQKFLIDVCGKERRRLLSFIRETIKEIANGFTNLTYRELVPIPDCVDTEDYDYLIEAEKADEKEIFVKALKKRIAIADLLDGIEEPTMRDEISQLPVKAFVSYAHKDLEYLKELRSALAPLIRLQKLELWDDHAINAGDDWNEVIFQQLEAADIVLCLISSDFVDSDFCFRKEFETALTSHRNGEKTIVPVMLRVIDWQGLPLSAIQATPGEWITSASNRDEAWTKVSKALRSILEQAQQRKHQRLRNQQMPLN